MAAVDLNDRRLNRRLKLILSHLAQHPTASIPAACGGYAEMAAAYRFFDNDKVDFDGVLRPHLDGHPHPDRRPTGRPDGPGHDRGRCDADPSSRSKAPGRSTAGPAAASSCT